MTGPRHFLDLHQLGADALREIIDHSARLKARRGASGQVAVVPGAPLAGKLLAMIFEKPSTRTRVSFHVAMRQLGGETLVLQGAEMQLGRGETVADTARVLSRYVDAIMVRTTSHASLLEMAKYASVPVINGLTDFSHPCQVMADILTFEEKRGPHRRPSACLVRRWQQYGAFVDSGCGGFRLHPASRLPQRITPQRKSAGLRQGNGRKG